MNRNNVYLRKDGRWEARFSSGTNENGKRAYISFYGKSREEAESKLIKYRQSTAALPELTDMTVNELSAKYLSTKSLRLKESTLSNYRMKLSKHIIPYIGSRKCTDIGTAVIYELIDRLHVMGLSPRYICDIIVLLRSLFKYAEKAHLCRYKLDSIELPKSRKPEIPVLSSEEQFKLTSYAAETASPVSLGTVISLYTGIRIGELCALQWKDIDLIKRELTVRKTIQRIQSFETVRKTKLVIMPPKSESSVRTIPIPGHLIDILKRYTGAEDDYVLSGCGSPIEPRRLQYQFRRLLLNAGLPSVTFHSLRHAFASKCIELGFDVKALSEILGHSSVEITLNRYVHSSFEIKKAYMDRLTFAA